MANETGRLEPALLTAARMLEWRRSRGQLGGGSAPEAVILTHQESLFRALGTRFWPRTPRGLFPKLRPLRGGQGRLAIAGGIGIGGPATALAVEELAATGVRRIMAIDVAGSIDARFRSGQVALASEALCGDGTSAHYAFGASRVRPNASIAERLAQALAEGGVRVEEGIVWSTDAPYRETAPEIERWRGRGAGLVDMETATLYATTAALGIEAAAILVVGDELFQGWRPPEDMQRIQAMLRRIADIARACALA